MTTVTKTYKTYHCAICDKQQRPERMVFSTHTRNRYCSDVDACKRRSRRRRFA